MKDQEVITLNETAELTLQQRERKELTSRHFTGMT